MKEGVFRCSYCVRTNKQNIFVAGKSTAKPKKDDFVKHERVEDHRMAAMVIHQNVGLQEHGFRDRSLITDGVGYKTGGGSMLSFTPMKRGAWTKFKPC